MSVSAALLESVLLRMVPYWDPEQLWKCKLEKEREEESCNVNSDRLLPLLTLLTVTLEKATFPHSSLTVEKFSWMKEGCVMLNPAMSVSMHSSVPAPTVMMGDAMLTFSHDSILISLIETCPVEVIETMEVVVLSVRLHCRERVK